MDLQVWLTFLDQPTVFCRPFLDFVEELDMDQLEFYMDASRNFSLGFGGYYKSSWMCQVWDKELMELCQPSIEYLELFALLAGVMAWIPRFQNRWVTVFTDNESVKNMVNNTATGCKNCMVLVRMLVLEGLIWNTQTN